MELFSREILAHSPDLFWQRGRPIFREMALAQPNRGHNSLAKLEHEGLIRGIISQNIDGLHQKAGSRVVLEVHGHLRDARCTGCGTTESMAPLLEVAEDSGAPRCSCGAVLRPEVVLFGDPLPEDFEKAWAWVRVCDLLLVVGSSLEVSPVCWLVPEAKKVAIINLGKSQGDGVAEIVVKGKAGDVLSSLVRILT